MTEGHTTLQRWIPSKFQPFFLLHGMQCTLGFRSAHCICTEHSACNALRVKCPSPCLGTPRKCPELSILLLISRIFLFCGDPNLKIVCARVMRNIEIKTGGLIILAQFNIIILNYSMLIFSCMLYVRHDLPWADESTVSNINTNTDAAIPA